MEGIPSAWWYFFPTTSHRMCCSSPDSSWFRPAFSIGEGFSILFSLSLAHPWDPCGSFFGVPPFRDFRCYCLHCFCHRRDVFLAPSFSFSPPRPAFWSFSFCFPKKANSALRSVLSFGHRRRAQPLLPSISFYCPSLATSMFRLFQYLFRSYRVCAFLSLFRPRFESAR